MRLYKESNVLVDGTAGNTDSKGYAIDSEFLIVQNATRATVLKIPTGFLPYFFAVNSHPRFTH